MFERISNYKKRSVIGNTIVTILGITIASVGGLAFKCVEIPESNIIVIYILSVLLIAVNTDGVVFGIIASVAETILFNYFFAEPYLTFSVNDPT